MTLKHLAGASVGAAALLLPLFAIAAELRSGDEAGVAQGVTIADDLYIGGGNINVAGAVKGDLYAGGGTVLIGGSVGQDVVAAGGTITILGSIADDVRVGGGTIVIQGTVFSDVMAGGGTITIAGGRVGGDVVAGGGVVRIDAPVAGDVRIGGGEVYLNAPIAGTVEIDADKLVLGPQAAIAGDLTYRSPRELTMQEGAVVSGKVTYEPRGARADGKAIAAAFFTAAALAKLFMLLAGAFFFSLVFRRYTQTLVESVYEAPLMELGRGFVLFVVLPVASVLLMVSVVGLPLGILGLLGFLGAVIFSTLMAPVVLGAWLYRLLKKSTHLTVNWRSILIGVFAFFILGFVPILGGFVQCALVLVTLGAALKIKWGVIKEWR